MVVQTSRQITEIEGQYATVEGLKTHYIQAGSGSSLLILHGAAPGGSARVIYGPCIEPLAARDLAVYAPDGPGFGLTDFPSDPSVEYRIKHARAFATAMSLERYHVMGNSAGVYPALRLAMEDPRVAKVVVIAGAGVQLPVSEAAQESAREHGQVLNAYTPGLENMRQLTRGTLYRNEFVTDELVKLRYEMSVGPNYEARQARQTVGTTQSSSPITPEAIKANYKAKTLIVWGKNDPGSVIQRAYQMLEIIPDAELHAFDNCGHWPMWDQTERFVSVVADFLQDGT